jgi:hypothetical protein
MKRSTRGQKHKKPTEFAGTADDIIRQNPTLPDVLNGLPRCLRHLCLEYITVLGFPISISMFFMQKNYKIEGVSIRTIKNANLYKFRRILKQYVSVYLTTGINEYIYFYDRRYDFQTNILVSRMSRDDRQYAKDISYGNLRKKEENWEKLRECEYVQKCVKSLTRCELLEIQEFYVKTKL